MYKWCCTSNASGSFKVEEGFMWLVWWLVKLMPLRERTIGGLVQISLLRECPPPPFTGTTTTLPITPRNRIKAALLGLEKLGYLVRVNGGANSKEGEGWMLMEELIPEWVKKAQEILSKRAGEQVSFGQIQREILNNQLSPKWTRAVVDGLIEQAVMYEQQVGYYKILL